MIGRARSVPPASRNNASSISDNGNVSDKSETDATKWASKNLAQFIEARNNMGHNNNHLESSSSETPVGKSVPRNALFSSRKMPGPGTPVDTAYRLNLPGAPVSRQAAEVAPQPIRSLRRQSMAPSYGPASSPFATDLTSNNKE